MKLPPKKQESLHNRVNDYLRGQPMIYAVDDSDEAAIEAIFDQLLKAEAELKGVQERVDRLKLELAKATS